MFAIQRNPSELLPEHLDSYLAHGWYRMGQAIFTTHFLTFNGDFFSALWLRLPLEGHTFKKRTARLIRQNRARFRCEFHPASIDAEKEHLYQLYREDFPAQLANSLNQSLLNGGKGNIFQTHEFRVYDGDKLIALSYFDLGANSSASILGIYHPEYKKESLGFFTMVMEIVYSMEKGLRYYYPGYVVPGYPRFDYKLRIGKVEYLSLAKGTWFPYDNLSPDEIPLQRMKNKLAGVSEDLRKASIPHRMFHYPLFEANLMDFWPGSFFDYPIMLCAMSPTPGLNYYIIVFDPRTAQYQLMTCSDYAAIDISIDLEKDFGAQETAYFNDLLEVEEVLVTTSDPEILVQKMIGVFKDQRGGNLD